MSRFHYAGVLLLVGLFSVGCNSVDDVTAPNAADTTAAFVDSAAMRVSREAPALLHGTSVVSQVWSQALTCPESFDLGNGITGNCDVYSDNDTIPEYGGDSYWWMPTNATLPSGSATVQVHFDLAVYRLDPAQHPSEYRCVVNDGRTSWTGGSLTWWASGVASDSSLELRTITGTWQSNASALILPPAGPVAVRAQIDRSTGTGTVTSSGAVVATIAVDGGCVSVDFADPQKEDLSSCLW